MTLQQFLSEKYRAGVGVPITRGNIREYRRLGGTLPIAVAFSWRGKEWQETSGYRAAKRNLRITALS